MAPQIPARPSTSAFELSIELVHEKHLELRVVKSENLLAIINILLPIKGSWSRNNRKSHGDYLVLPLILQIGVKRGEMICVKSHNKLAPE